MAGEKTEEATENRLSNAKKEGRVSKSLEFNAVLMLLAFIAILFTDMNVKDNFRMIMQYILQFLQGENIVDSYGSALFGLLVISSKMLLPFFLIFLLVAVVSNLLQIGFVFSVKAISPDFSRLDPVKGMKKIFNSKVIYDVFRILAKLFLGYTIFYIWLSGVVKRGIHTANFGGADELLDVLIGEFILLLLLVSLLLALSAIVDVVYTRKKFNSDMKMSKQEIKEENKSKDGDPEIKSKRKKYMTEIMKNSGVYKSVGDSDFILVNPVHFAVLIKYDRASMVAPKVIGRARGGQVSRIKEIARTRGVAIIKNVKLTRSIYFSSKVGGYIPLDTYEEIAGLYMGVKS